MKKLKIATIALGVISLTLLSNQETLGKEQGLDDDLGNCCSWPAQVCMVGGQMYDGYLYSTGSGCPQNN